METDQLSPEKNASFLATNISDDFHGMLKEDNLTS